MMSKNGLILIIFAWAMEIVGVAGGVTNSTYTTFGEDLPNTLSGYLPAVPMVALAVAELGRVPLASVLYHKHKFMRGVAILGVAALGYLAVENWTFGFERIVDLRLKPVNAAARELSRAQADLSALEQDREQGTASSRQKREELRRGIAQRDTNIAELTAQLGKEAEAHRKNLEQIREACRIISGPCMVPRSQAEDRRYAELVSRLSAALTRHREERQQLQSQIDQLVTTDAAQTAEVNQRIGAAAAAVVEARKAWHTAADGNQIYRLAGSWYGVNTSAVTPEQFATARWVFATFSAIAVALAGSIAALVYYARSRVHGAPSLFGKLAVKVARARRAYYARKRKPLRVEMLGPERLIYRDGKEPPIVVEKEVPRFVDHIVLIPRWGIRAPTYVNSLIRGRDRSPRVHSKSDELVGLQSNVTPLAKRAH
jgi:flagellar biosynthesis chaperone FliJ